MTGGREFSQTFICSCWSFIGPSQNDLEQPHHESCHKPSAPLKIRNSTSYAEIPLLSFSLGTREKGGAHHIL
jgi:hypothetical protein